MSFWPREASVAVVKLGAWVMFLISTGGFAFSFYAQMVCASAERDREAAAQPAPAWQETVAQLNREEQEHAATESAVTTVIAGADGSPAGQ